MLEIRNNLYEDRSTEDSWNQARWTNFSGAWNTAAETGQETENINTYITWHNMGTRMGLLLGPATKEEKRAVFDALLTLYRGQRERGVAFSSCLGPLNSDVQKPAEDTDTQDD